MKMDYGLNLEIEIEDGYYYARWGDTSIIGVGRTMKRAINNSLTEAKTILEVFKKIPEEKQSFGIQQHIHWLSTLLSNARWMKRRN